MVEGDIPAGLSLCRTAGWNQTKEDWELFLHLSPEGCCVAVVYEMVTGKRAFEGKSQASLIGAIMNSEPRSPLWAPDS